MGSIRFLCLILCLICSCARPTNRQTIAKVSQELKKFSLSQKSSIKIDKLGGQIQQLAQLQKVPPTLSPLWSSTLTKAIAIYQFLYFLKPNAKHWQKLQKFYLHFDQHQSDFKDKYSFYTLRKILAHVKLKSEQAPSNLEKILALLHEPKFYDDFFKQLRSPYEVGGVILVSGKEVKIRIIENPNFARHFSLIKQFEKNNFRNLLFLKKAFLERLLLRKIGADKETRIHTNILIRKTLKNFAVLEKPNSSIEQIQKAKKELTRIGLKRKLLSGTFYIDKSKYLEKKDTAFFFHTHPERKYPYFYEKKPSGQDRELTFRTGPSLVFDIQKKFIDLYSVVLGKSTRVKRFNH